jgi:16S rRNA (uracil1498-N3)-methyltransferase
MQLFWGSWTADGKAALSPDEANHAARVLRKVPGDVIHVGNGQGDVARVELQHVAPKAAWGTVLEVIPQFGAVPGTLHMVLCPTKSLDRTEWAVEKGVELGVSSFHLALANRSERRHASVDRLQKIVDSAAKQSLKGLVPKIHEAVPLASLWGHAQWDFCQKGLLHCMESPKTPLLTWPMTHGKPVVLAVGPEGDFTPEEAAAAAAQGWEALTLGYARLRTETAVVTAAALVLQRWETALVVHGNPL